MDLSASQVKRKKQETKAEEAALLAGLEDLYKAGFVSEGDYESRKAEITRASEKARAQKIFKRFDTDNSGEIDAKEFQVLAFALGEAMTEDDVSKLIAGMDKSGKGSVNFDDFYAWWCSHDKAAGSKSDFLKLKLRSKNYMKNVSFGQKKLAQSVAKVTKKAEATPEDDEFEDQLNFTLKMDCGEVKNPDSGIELTWQSDYGVGEDTKPHVLIEFLCKQPVSVIEQEFSSVTKKMGEFLQKELAEEEFPVKDINYQVEERDGKVYLRFIFNLVEEMAAMAHGFVEAANVKKCHLKSCGDKDSKATTFLFELQVSRNVIELCAELGAPPEFVTLLDLYCSSTLSFKLRTLDALAEVSPEFANMMVPGADGKPPQEVIDMMVAELGNPLLRWGYLKVVNNLDTISELSVVFGNTKVQMKLDVPGWIQLFDIGDKLPPSGAKPVPDNCPATIENQSIHEHTLHLTEKPNDGCGIECCHCGEFVFEAAYVCKHPDCDFSGIEPACALGLAIYEV